VRSGGISGPYLDGFADGFRIFRSRSARNGTATLDALLNALPGELYEIENLLSLGREYKPVGNVDGLVRLINEATEKNKAKMMQKSPEKGQPLEAKA
jgi:hypothetical protein